MKILQNEMDTLNLVEEIVKKEGIDCDFWRGLSYGAPLIALSTYTAELCNPDVALDQSCADFFKSNYDEFVADGGVVDGIVNAFTDPEDAAKVLYPPPSLSLFSLSFLSFFFHLNTQSRHNRPRKAHKLEKRRCRALFNCPFPWVSNFFFPSFHYLNISP